MRTQAQATGRFIMILLQQQPSWTGVHNKGQGSDTEHFPHQGATDEGSEQR